MREQYPTQLDFQAIQTGNFGENLASWGHAIQWPTKKLSASDGQSLKEICLKNWGEKISEMFP